MTLRLYHPPTDSPHCCLLLFLFTPFDTSRLYALAQQATSGDNTSERPMWAEKGGLDFEGRARWDAWAAVKGVEAEQAK